jgi:hypothetical protein
MKRTPQVKKCPPRLLRKTDYPRTPVIDGRFAKPLGDLVAEGAASGDVETTLKLSEVAPELEPLWGQAHDSMIKNSLSYFFAEVISGPAAHPYNGKSLVGWHHIEWDEIVGEHDRFLIEAARDHGKSHFFSLAYPIWMGGYVCPGELGYIFSATQRLSEDLLELVKNELLTNPKLAHLVPTTRDRFWTRSEIRLRNGTVIRARGMGVKVRGGHPRWIIVDDGLSDEDIYSETIRKRNIDFFQSAITNMVVPDGQIGVVGTPMHYGDLYGRIKETGEYFHKKYPAISKEGKILFPERYDKARLNRRKREVGTAKFAREFLCQPLTDEASLFPSTLFQGGNVRLPYRLGLPGSYWEEKGFLRYTGVDFAMSSSASADWTVIFTVAVDDQGTRWLANIRRGKGWAFQRQLDEIKDENTLMRPEMIHAEANQMQRIFTDEIVRETDLPIRKFYTAGVQPKRPWQKGMASLTMGKHHMDRGVPSLRITLENRKWRIPRGDEQSIEKTDIWMGEMMAMSWQDGKVISVGDHDDCVMAMWMADSAVRLGGFRFSFGEGDQPPAEPLQISEQPQTMSAPKPAAEPQKVAPEPKVPVPSDDWRPAEGAPSATDLGFGGNFGF